MIVKEATRLNLGSGAYPKEGFTNVDIEDAHADVIGDFTKMEFAGVEEVEMSHVLEHISWQSTAAVLRLVRSWMVDGGSIRIEVPDMEAIMARGIFDIAAQIAIYGIQSAQGEFHLAGFTWNSLRAHMLDAGFSVVSGRSFASGHPERIGFPCLEVIGTAA